MGLVTLGSPHLPPLAGTPDMTRGALTFVDNTFPGAYLKDHLFYMTVAGTAVTSDPAGSQLEKFATDSYPQVSGIRDTRQVGDGVVPLSCAHLDGSFQLTLPG